MKKIGRPPGSEIMDDASFIRLFEEHGLTAMAKVTGLSASTINKRRRRVEQKTRRPIRSPNEHYRPTFAEARQVEHPGRIKYTLQDGVAIIGSDLHIWPGPVPVMHRAFVKFCRKYEPGIVVLNGDVVDMAAVSRHPPIGWEHQPTVKEEIETAQERLHEIEMATAPGTPQVWTLGNHDARFETRLATVAPEYAKLNGVHLRDHFPNWEPCWSCWINDDVVVKHRFKGGIHAPWNNTINSGKTIVTGHLHSAKVTPFTDYNGTRYGVDAGCMADTDHQAFLDYTEDNPKNWRSAFAILTFVDGALLVPELVIKWDETRVQFRGELIEV